MRQDTNTTTTSTSTQESPDVADSGSVGRHPRSTSPTSGTATRVVDRSWVVVGAVVVTIAIVAGVWIALASDTSSTTSDGATRAEAANQLRRAEVDTIAGNAVDISTVAERANQRRQIEAGVPLDQAVPNGSAIAADKANSLRRADARPTRSGADLAAAANDVRRADAQIDTVSASRDGAALAQAANGIRQADATATPATTRDGARLAAAAGAVRQADAAGAVREADAAPTSTTTHDGAALAEAANGIRQDDTPGTTGDAVAAEKANRLRQAG